MDLDLGGSTRMLSIILTWVGALFGIVVLLAMASGAFILDFDDALGDRLHRNRTATDSSPPPPDPTPLTGS
jgi:hypothetical protein